MKLNITKDTIVFDLETTGLSPVKDKIIQIAILKLFADGRDRELKVRYINPERPIPEIATKINGITDEHVKNAPKFAQVAKGILKFIGEGTDIITFNGNHFDISFLMSEFNQVGIDFDMTGRRTIDVKRLYHNLCPRSLRTAHREFVGKPIDKAHDAGADTVATLDVLEAMLDRYVGVDVIDGDDELMISPVKNDIDVLYNFTKNHDAVDYGNTMKYDENNVPIFAFGKYNGLPVAENLAKDPSYHNWIENVGEKFTIETKRIMNKLVYEYKKAQLENDDEKTKQVSKPIEKVIS